jgi:hypothetical protein
MAFRRSKIPVKCVPMLPKLIVWICLEEEYYEPYSVKELKRKVSCILHPGVIDCVSNTALEVIQEEFDLPTKIHASPICRMQFFL